MFNVPTSQMILGTVYEGKPNFMALGWVTRVNAKPALFGIGVNKAHVTHDAILEEGEFSLSLPSTDMVEVTDHVGTKSGRKENKFETTGLTPVASELTFEGLNPGLYFFSNKFATSIFNSLS